MKQLLRPIYHSLIRRSPVSKRHVTRSLSSLATDRDQEKYIVKSPLKNVNIPKNKKLSQDLLERMERWPEYIAIECGETKKRYTYAQIIKSSENFSRMLRENNFIDGSRRPVGILLPNCPEFASTFIGALEVDLPITTINPNYTAREIAYQLQNSHVGLVVCLPSGVVQAQEAIEQLPPNLRPPIAIADHDFHLFPNHSKRLPPSEFTELLDPEVAVLPYSSGTTGLPKGVKLTHYNLLANIYQMDIPEMKSIREPTGGYQTVIPAILPFFHIYGMIALVIYPLRNGGRLVALPKFDPVTYINVLNTNKVTHLFLAPPLVLFMSGSPHFNKKNLEHVEMVTSGAAPIGAKDLDKLLPKLSPKAKILQGYGMTECSPIVTSISLSSWKEQLGSVGIPIPNTDVRVVNTNDSKTNQPSGEVGEIWVRGPQVMKGYLGNKKDTDEMMLPDGWLRTGDLGYYNEQGNFYIVDRLKELIKVKGLQVAPAELEVLLRSHPSISDAAVIGISDERLGEAPRAYVVLKSDGPATTAKEVAKFIADRVSDHKKLIGGVEFIDSIPKNAAGKILRKDIKTKYLKK